MVLNPNALPASISSCRPRTSEKLICFHLVAIKTQVVPVARTQLWVDCARKDFHSVGVSMKEIFISCGFPAHRDREFSLEKSQGPHLHYLMEDRAIKEHRIKETSLTLCPHPVTPPDSFISFQPSFMKKIMYTFCLCVLLPTDSSTPGYRTSVMTSALKTISLLIPLLYPVDRGSIWNSFHFPFSLGSWPRTLLIFLLHLWEHLPIHLYLSWLLWYWPSFGSYPLSHILFHSHPAHTPWVIVPAPEIQLPPIMWEPPNPFLLPQGSPFATDRINRLWLNHRHLNFNRYKTEPMTATSKTSHSFVFPSQ